MKDPREEKRADEPAIPINPSRMCPALILAANRNDKVINRTEILTVSVNTRKEHNQSGAPLGSKWATKDFGAWTIALIISLIHKGNPKDKVNKRWLEDLNTYGSRPRRLSEINIKNKATNRLGNPFKCKLNVREAWEFITSTGNVGIHENRDGEAHNEAWRREMEKKDNIQNNEGERE